MKNITAAMVKSEILVNYTMKKRISAWNLGVFSYAFDLLDNLDADCAEALPTSINDLEELFLNGAGSWNEYSWGGCSLIYDGDIAERLCTSSELRKTRNGERKPNSSEEWLDVQVRALYQAFGMILRTVRRIARAM